VKTTGIIVLILAMLTTHSAAQQPQLNCKIGPVTKSYGGTNWLVYSCDDKHSILFATAPGNPAMPFYFILYRHEGRSTLYGEGTGNKDTTSAAFADLGKLSEKEIAEIIEQTKTH
jgi:hypothetical protein